MEKFTGKKIEAFQLSEKHTWVIFFQTKNDLETAVSAHPEEYVPLLGMGGKSDNDFPNVFAALKKIPCEI